MIEKIQWSGKTSSYHHKWNDTPNSPNEKLGFRKVWFLDAQWSTCPIEVEKEVRSLWQSYELGNDNFIVKTYLSDLDEEYVAIRQYILEMQPDIGEEELIIIHWWW